MQRPAPNNCDLELWCSFLEGDKASFKKIYEIYYPVLYEYGVRLYKNSETVKDCIQDLFVKLWSNRQKLSSTNAVKPYLFTALRNTVINKLEGNNRMTEREGNVSKLHSFDLYYTIEDALIERDEHIERRNQMLTAINELTSRQKESIFLRFYVGLEYKEIAETMQISVKASYKIIGRAITSMRKYFEGIALYI